MGRLVLGDIYAKYYRSQQYYNSGALGVIEGTTSVYPKTIPHRIELHGDRGSIMVEGEGVKRWEVMGEDGKVISKLEEVQGTEKAITNPTDIGMEGHIRLVRDMVEAIKKDREPLIIGEEGRKAIQIILAIYQSAKTGKPVRL